jgi:hypothetical protein
MQSKTFIMLIVATIMGISSTAMAKGGGGGGKGGWSHGGMRGQFDNRFRFNDRFLRNQFLRNQALLNGWGWGWGWGWGGYGDSGYSNTNVVVYPIATPQFATGSTTATPCSWNEDAFKVPSVFGGTQEVSVVSCRQTQQ